MALVDRDSVKVAPRPSPKVAILVFNGVEIIDYTGPYEMFGAAGFDVYTVAATRDPVTTAMGMTVVPKYTFADAPLPDVLVVPGGGVRGARDSAPTRDWLRATSARTTHTMSVCNGAFILASAGMLDGLTATTTSHNIEKLRAEFPKIKVVSDQRVVDNGRIVTTAGLSAGIDGALHVISRMLGPGTAQAVALGEEYDWRPKSGFVRAALADRLIPDLPMDTVDDWSYVRTEGGADRWEVVVRMSSALGASDLMAKFGGALASRGKWTSDPNAPAGSATRASSRWRFHDADGRRWKGDFLIERAPGETRALIATLSIARAG